MDPSAARPGRSVRLLFVLLGSAMLATLAFGIIGVSCLIGEASEGGSKHSEEDMMEVCKVRRHGR